MSSCRDYRNPVIPGFYPDPSICRAGQDYYLVNSTFEYFPGVPVFHSRDLVNWRQIGHCLTRRSQLNLEGARGSRGGIWAPTIRYHDGLFYMVTTNQTHGGNFFVYTDDPAGDWSEPVWVDQRSIDPSFLFDDDGKVYLTTAPALQSEIDIAGGELLTEPRVTWEGTGGSHMEGPHLYKIDGTYYLLVAEGGTGPGHMVTIARSSSPWGPFEPCPHNPILTHAGREDTIIQCTGHGDLIQDHRGNWWMVFLAVRVHEMDRFQHIGRETFLAPVEWSRDGWPIVNTDGTVTIEMDADRLPPHPWEPAPVRDDFDGPSLGLCWNFIRNPYEKDWSLRDRPGWLRLTGSAVTLGDTDSPAFVGRRQQHFDCRACTLLDFAPKRDGEEAGLGVRMNERFHYLLAVTRLEGRRCAVVRLTVEEQTTEVARETLGEGPITLEIRSDWDRYYFSFAAEGQAPGQIAAAEAKNVSTNVAGGFTGVYLAMYATGNGRDSTTPAFFDWFDYEAPARE